MKKIAALTAVLGKLYVLPRSLDEVEDTGATSLSKWWWLSLGSITTSLLCDMDGLADLTVSCVAALEGLSFSIEEQESAESSRIAKCIVLRPSPERLKLLPTSQEIEKGDAEKMFGLCKEVKEKRETEKLLLLPLIASPVNIQTHFSFSFGQKPSCDSRYGYFATTSSALSLCHFCMFQSPKIFYPSTNPLGTDCTFKEPKHQEIVRQAELDNVPSTSICQFPAVFNFSISSNWALSLVSTTVHQGLILPFELVVDLMLALVNQGQRGAALKILRLYEAEYPDLSQLLDNNGLTEMSELWLCHKGEKRKSLQWVLKRHHAAGPITTASLANLVAAVCRCRRFVDAAMLCAVAELSVPRDQFEGFNKEVVRYTQKKQADLHETPCTLFLQQAIAECVRSTEDIKAILLPCPLLGCDVAVVVHRRLFKFMVKRLAFLVDRVEGSTEAKAKLRMFIGKCWPRIVIVPKSRKTERMSKLEKMLPKRS